MGAHRGRGHVGGECGRARASGTEPSDAGPGGDGAAARGSGRGRADLEALRPHLPLREALDVGEAPLRQQAQVWGT